MARINAEKIAKAYIARCDRLKIVSSYSMVARAFLVAIEALEFYVEHQADCFDYAAAASSALAKIRGKTK